MPTIGILPRIGNLETSGKIFTMTDSDCVDTNSISYQRLYDFDYPATQNWKFGNQLPKKCFWLVQKFAEIASGKIVEDSLLNETYKLPNDFLARDFSPSNAFGFKVNK